MRLVAKGSFCFWLLLLPFFGEGQEWQGGGPRNGVVYGQVLDSLTKNPLPYASVFLFRRDSLIGGSLTDTKGWFRIEKLPPGPVLVKIEFLGYETYVRRVLIAPPGSEIDLGKLLLQPKEIQLKDVEIVEEKPRMEVQIDRIVYDPSKDIGVQGGDATDVLRRVPYLTVDNEGRISIRGSQNVRIFINGQPSLMFLTNPEDALRSLPADQIEKVEVITVPGAKYDAEGSGGIVNIVLKKQKVEGHTGSVDAGIGNFMGNLNGSIGWKWKKWGLQFNVGGRYRYRGDGYTKFYWQSGNSEVYQDGVYYPKRGGGRVNVGLSYEITPHHLVEFNLGAHGFLFIRESRVNVFATGLEPYTRYSENPKDRTSVETSLNYRIRSTRSEWNFLGSYEKGWNRERYTLLQNSSLDSLNLNERSFNYGSTQNGQFQVDHTHHLTEKWDLEAGGKGTWRSFTSDYTYEFFNPLAAEYQNDTFRSNQLSFFQAIYAAYTQLTYRRKPWQVTTGVRYELTVNEMVSGSSTFDQRYDNWVPNFSVGYQLDKGRMIRLNYGFRIQRPFYQELNPFTNASDPRNQSKGNPDLLPELTHNIELGFPPFITAFARFTDQIITSYTIVIDSGVTLTMPVNAGKREDYGFSLFFQQRFFKQKLAVMISGDVFWSRIQGLFQSNEGWQSVLRSLITYTPSPRLVFEAMASFNSNQITLQGYQPVFNMYQFSVLYYLDKSRKLGVRAFVMNPFTPYYEFRSKVRGNGFYQEQVNGVAFRQFGIGIRYQFSELNPRPRRGGGAGSEAMEVY